MNDLSHAGTLFLVFALALLVYGLILYRTGDKELLPYRAMNSVRNKADVRRVGRIVMVIGLVVAVLSLLLKLVSRG